MFCLTILDRQKGMLHQAGYETASRARAAALRLVYKLYFKEECSFEEIGIRTEKELWEVYKGMVEIMTDQAYITIRLLDPPHRPY